MPVPLPTRRLGTLGLILCLATATGPALAKPGDRPAPPAEPRPSLSPNPFSPNSVAPATLSFSLADRGFADGIALQGISDGATVYFPGIPAGIGAEGHVTLDLTEAVAGLRHWGLTVSVNELPRLVIDKDTALPDGRITVPLSASELRQPFVKLGLTYRAAASDDLCFDQRIIGNFVRLGPDSALSISYDPRTVGSLDQAWRLLPHQPRIGIGGSADAATAGSALALGLGLVRSGRPPEFVALPATGGRFVLDEATAPTWNLIAEATGRAAARPGETVALANPTEAAAALVAELAAGHAPDLIIAPAAALTQLTDGVKALRAALTDPKVWAGLAADLESLTPTPTAEGDAALWHMGRHPLIALKATPSSALAAGWLTGPFEALGLSPAATVATARSTPSPTAADGAVSLGALGLSAAEHALVDTSEWRVALSAGAMPPGRVPSALDLVVSVPRLAGEPPVMLYGYLDDALIATQALADRDGPQPVHLDLPAGTQILDRQIRIVLQRRPSGGSCKSPVAPVPAEILPASLVRTAAGGSARTFPGLAPSLGGGVPVYLAEPVAADASALNRTLAAAVPILAGLMPAEAEIGAVTLVAPATAITPTSPFIAIGTLAGLQAPVELNAGRIVIAGTDGKPLIDLAGPSLGVIEVARAGGQTGLWLQTTGGSFPPLPAAATFDHGSGDVAFFDAGGPLLRFDSQADRAARVVYPDRRDWIDWLGAYRNWFLALGWIGITALFVYLLKKVYQHRAKG